MTFAEHLTSKISLACAAWAIASLSCLAAPKAVQEQDSLWQQWVQLDSAAVSTYAPLLPSEQITMSLWTADSALTTGFGSPDVANALNAIPGVLMENPWARRQPETEHPRFLAPESFRRPQHHALHAWLLPDRGRRHKPRGMA